MQLKISPINLINIQKTSNSKFTPPLKLNALNCDTVSFSAKTNKISEADRFLKKFNQVYPEMNIYDAAYEFTSKDENKLGEGVSKVVYSIDGIDDYVIARLKKENKKAGVKFQKCENPYPKYDFSLPVLENNKFMIMKKLEGKSIGIDDWHIKYKGVVKRGEKIDTKDAKEFLQNIIELEKLPLESFVDFANQAKYLSDRGVKIDLFNPNNVMIDFANKKIQYFDFFEDFLNFSFLKPDINCTQDIICVLCDALLHDEFMKALDDSDKEKLYEATKSIIQKCETAGKIAGLSDDSSISEKTYSYVQDFFIKKGLDDNKFLEYYEKFEDIYS